MKDPTENLKVKTIQFAVGIDLLGSKLTLSSKGNQSELIDLGNAVVAVSHSNGRVVKIPYTNLKGIEYFSDPAKEIKKAK